MDFRGMIYVPSLMTIGSAIRLILRALLKKFEGLYMSVILMKGIYNTRHWDGLRWHDRYFTGFVKICTGVQVILRFVSEIYEISVLVILLRGICDVRPSNCLWPHDIRIKFHDDRFRHSSNITVNTATIWEAVLLVLLIEGIYELSPWYGLISHDIRIKFHEDLYSLSRNINVLHQKSERLVCWYYRCERFMNYALEMPLSVMIY
jgi:hypothetical protein